MSVAIQILPKTHILQGMVAADNWTPAKAISEFVDNSFGEAAGNADHVVITIARDSLTIEDNGDGMENIASLFILGQSGSFSSDTDIGRYGRGAKEACIWLGEHTQVATWRGHKKTFCAVDWQSLIDQGPDAPWPTISPQSEIIADESCGTRIVITGLRRKHKLHVPSLSKILGETYAIALRAGKVIILADERRKPFERIVIEPYRPEGLTDVIKFDGEVNGKRYNAEVGVLSEVYSSHSGLRISYAHRVIERKMVLSGRSIPARIFGYVMLSREWKENLSTNKTELIDADDLDADLLDKCAAIFALAQEFQEDVIIDGLNVRLSNVITECWRKDESGEETGGREQPVKDGENNRKRHPNPPMTPTQDGIFSITREEKRDRRGLRITATPMGAHGVVGIVEEDRHELVININKQSPLVRRAIADQQGRGRTYTSGYVMMLGFLLAKHAHAQGVKWSQKYFKDIPDDEQNIFDKIMIWWSCEATKPIWQKEDACS